ncbi:MAG TPA: enoyl-CoA hydratase/isomerase family protein [Candidatus Acidoferrales bacterium]|nr:enoyl-CoA hydratase/isomerase family protein [Candidatus Acidoferrales bacterium]
MPANQLKRFLYNLPAMSNLPPPGHSSEASTHLVEIQRTAEVLTFILNNPDHGNEVTGPMFDAMLAELRSESPQPRARVLRIRARGKVFCTGRERSARDLESVRTEVSRLIEFKRLVRTSSLISVAEVQGDAFGFGMGLAIVTDFPLVADTASLCFPEMSHGLAPAAIMSYLGEYALPRFAFPLVLFGEPFTPQQAFEIGLISMVRPAAQLSAVADKLIARILQLDPGAARRCKEFFLSAQSNSFDKNCSLAVEALTAGTMAALARKK